ncbi:hypothetical protein EYF80_065685 [Liparis tanakae]|uniref:Uncharacterized protein n=1 Tax=Liparis tanakae TaxID=230148 RepID=A0A4Z2E6H1_9TELE|nr:hypothetical protein EYF80_065685 [Liparis tanakae]
MLGWVAVMRRDQARANRQLLEALQDQSAGQTYALEYLWLPPDPRVPSAAAVPRVPSATPVPLVPSAAPVPPGPVGIPASPSSPFHVPNGYSSSSPFAVPVDPRALSFSAQPPRASSS